MKIKKWSLIAGAWYWRRRWLMGNGEDAVKERWGQDGCLQVDCSAGHLMELTESTAHPTRAQIP